MNMDLILSQLVEVDKKAVSLVEAAEDKLIQTKTNMDKEVSLLKEQYAKEAEEQIGVKRAEVSEHTTELAEDVLKRYQILKENLETTYQQNHQKWEDELFSRCLEKQ